MRNTIQNYGIKSILSRLNINKSVIYIVIICIMALLLSMKRITYEGAVSMHGDPPRHMMNGVFFYDLIRDFPLTNPLEYALQYFARYPALSLGHHPMLLGVAEVPFYTVFGVSVFSARLTIVFFMVLAGIMWFLLIRMIYDENIAFFSSSILITTPFVVASSRIVMTEVPTLALIIVAAYFFCKYCELHNKGYAFAFIITFILSVFTKQLAIFMLPVFIFCFFMTKGVRILFTKKAIIFCIIFTLLLLPLIFISLKYSQMTIVWISRMISSDIELSRFYDPFIQIWRNLLTLPVLIFSLFSICLSIFLRDKRVLLFVLWIICFWLLITFLGVRDARYNIYWIPPFCLFAATARNIFRYRLWKIIFSLILTVVIGYQFVVAYHKEPAFAEGYEQAAKYVVENPKGESVLFMSKVDTGYFVFFVRKHDLHKNMIVLRADKLLVTSSMSYIVEERITTRNEIYEIIEDFGVSYVVIEESEFESLPLKWLKEEVKSQKFILHKRIPIRSTDFRLQDLAVNIYEYKGYTPPKPGKLLYMNIPLMNDSISIEFDDLLHKTIQ
ncbi:MAG: ArnT family glycosyltransferase [Planctomycetota bacterium]